MSRQSIGDEIVIDESELDDVTLLFDALDPPIYHGQTTLQHGLTVAEYLEAMRPPKHFLRIVSKLTKAMRRDPEVMYELTKDALNNSSEIVQSCR